MKAEFPFDCLKPEAIAALAEDITYAKATKPAYKIIPLAITAGAFIAIAFIFHITVTTGTGSMPWGMAKLVGGLLMVALIIVSAEYTAADGQWGLIVLKVKVAQHKIRHSFFEAVALGILCN